MTPTGNGSQDADTTGTTAPVSVDTKRAKAPTASTPALLRTAAQLDALPAPPGPSGSSS
ncbi:hypothetical protein GTX14_00795 [Streptomyces sp. SID4944]|nr:hypothetical protein [Streptomyces sp. SID4944]